MGEYYWDVWRDTWFSRANGSTKYGNGLGPRLQSGFNAGTDDYENRFGISYQEPADWPGYGETIESATIYMKVRGTNSCFSRGGSPKLLIRRFLDPNEVIAENGQAGECNLSGAGSPDTEWPGPDTTSTGQVLWEGTPSTGDIISKDVTALFTAWVAAKAGGTDKFGLMFWPSNAAGNAEEQIASRKIAFSSADADGDPLFDGGLGPYMKVVTSAANTAPIVEPYRPANASVQTGLTSRTFDILSTDPEDAAGVADGLVDPLSSIHIVVATSNHVDGNGKLDTGVVHDSDDPSSGISIFYYRTTRTFTQVAGTTYYWQAAGTDTLGPDKGPWSSVFSYSVAAVPTYNKVRPA